MTQAQAQALAAFRVVVRGNNKDGKRIRRVKNVMAADANDAAVKGEAMAMTLIEGLTNPYFNVYPPVGELCNGGLSKGFELVDGLVTKTGKIPATVAAAPVKAAAKAVPAKTPSKRKAKAVATPPAAAPAASATTTAVESTEAVKA